MNYITILSLGQRIQQLPTKNLKPKEVLGLVKLSKELQTSQEQYFEVVKNIMASNDIEQKEGGEWDIPEDKKAEINGKVNELLAQEAEVKSLNFINEDSFMSMVTTSSDMTVADVQIFYELLVEKEDENKPSTKTIEMKPNNSAIEIEEAEIVD